MNYFNYISEKAYAKINLSFRILGKTSNNYHTIDSIVTFLPDIYDVIKIKKNKKLIICTKGDFSESLAKKGGDTLVKKMIILLKKKFFIADNFKVIIDKNIPLGAGLGGGSADAAAIARVIIKMYKIQIDKKEIIKPFSKIGADIPVCFFSCNQRVNGIGEKLTKLKLLNKIAWVILIKPKENFNTKNIFDRYYEPFSKKPSYEYTYENLINDMNKNENDLQIAAKRYSLIFSNLLNKLPKNSSATFPRMTGSGSCCFAVFENLESAIKAQKKFKSSFPKLWNFVAQNNNTILNKL